MSLKYARLGDVEKGSDTATQSRRSHLFFFHADSDDYARYGQRTLAYRQVGRTLLTFLVIVVGAVVVGALAQHCTHVYFDRRGDVTDRGMGPLVGGVLRLEMVGGGRLRLVASGGEVLPRDEPHNGLPRVQYVVQKQPFSVKRVLTDTVFRVTVGDGDNVVSATLPLRLARPVKLGFGVVGAVWQQAIGAVVEQTLDEPALTAAQLQRLGEVCRAQDNRLRIDVIQRLWELPMPDSESSFAEGIVDGTVVPRDTIIRGTLVNCGAMTNDVFQADLTDISLLHDLPVDSFLQTTLAPIIRAIFGEESNVVDASATFTDDTAAAWDMKDGSVAAWDMEDVSSEDRPAAYHFSSGSNVIEVEVVERRTESETANDGVSVEDARAAVSNAGAFARIFDRMHSLLQ